MLSNRIRIVSNRKPQNKQIHKTQFSFTFIFISFFFSSFCDFGFLNNSLALWLCSVLLWCCPFTFHPIPSLLPYYFTSTKQLTSQPTDHIISLICPKGITIISLNSQYPFQYTFYREVQKIVTSDEWQWTGRSSSLSVHSIKKKPSANLFNNSTTYWYKRWYHPTVIINFCTLKVFGKWNENGGTFRQ